jgi:polysaccharide export outer membrane protein
MSRCRIVQVGLGIALVSFCFNSSLAQTVVEPVTAVPGGPAKPLAQVTPLPTNTDTDRDKLRIGAGDLLEVSVYGVSDFKQEGRVSDSGDMTLPLVGGLHIGGLTVDEAQAKVSQALVEGGYFRDPHVSVLIKDFASQGISVMGEVEKPGVYPAMSTRRLYDLVSQAGGFTAKAGKTVTITHRDRPTDPENIPLTSDPAKSMTSNITVYPGDTIVVSKAGIVYVVGDVGRPGGFVMENGERMTVLQAIAMAQGVNRTAAVGSARLIRRSTGKPEEIKVPLKGIMSAKANDVDLMPEDILFIPGSMAKNAMRRGLESVLQIATSAAIYGAH